MNIGIFGGTFNPPHKAHLKVAKNAIKQLKLNILYFVPNNISPHKINESSVSGYHRMKMLKLMIGDKKKLKISNYEIRRNNISYSADTIKYFKDRFRKSKLYFIVGSDNLGKLSTWKNIDYILKNSQIVIAPRNKKTKNSNYIVLKMKPIDISSSLIRNKINNKISCKKYFTKEVNNYQFVKQLYCK